MFKIYTDASTKGKIGPSGVGILIIHDKEQTQLNIPLRKHYTNHQAEFIAQILAFEYLNKNFKIKDELIQAYTDSKLVISSLEKNYADEQFQPYLVTLQKYFAQSSTIFLKWIPEAQNKGADNLARQALSQAIKGKFNSKIEKTLNISILY